VFWANSKAGDYEKEVDHLKKTFSEEQKTLIKNNVLKVKDFIEWTSTNPQKALSVILTAEIDSLLLLPDSGDFNPGMPFPFTNQSLKGAFAASRVPICILDGDGNMMYSFTPQNMDTAGTSIKDKNRLLDLVMAAVDEKGIITLYDPGENGDSVLKAIGYYNNRKIPGFKTVSMISPGEFNPVIKHYLLDSISKIRFSENDYVFVNTMDGEALVTHGKYNNPPLKIIESGDSVWKAIFKVQQKAYLNPEGGFHTYPWSKLSSTEMSVKTSFFSHVPDWHWIIGTGFYEDDINAVIESKKQALLADLRVTMNKVLFYLLFSLLVSYFLSRFFSNRLEKNIILFRDFFDKSSSGNHYIDKSKIYYQEFDFMADSANRMVDARIVAEAEIKKLHEELEERVLIRTRQLHDANKELESFSYSVSHDLRAPLRAINGFSSILANRHRNSLNDEGRKYIDYVVEASQRMDNLIRDLLNYSRIGRKIVVPGKVSLNDLFESIIMDFKSDIEESGSVFIKGDKLPDIISDIVLLHQIFTNLVSNAIIYRRKDVPLVIRASYKHEDNYHIISLEDNGIGISEEHWAKIFNVFQRLHNEEAYPGTGIGLASVKKAVTLLEGSVWVESQLKKGTTFFIKLPDYQI
jgi:signal transduction histidine kinase